MGWSVKKLIRELVLSRTFAMSSAPADAAAEQADPKNILLHRANLPLQALILMNDPFVEEQAKLWSQRTSTDADAAQRVRQMYRAAFSRSPTPEEIIDAHTFLAGQRALHGANDPKGERAWADFARVLFNVKEFIYLH